MSEEGPLRTHRRVGATFAHLHQPAVKIIATHIVSRTGRRRHLPGPSKTAIP